MAGSRFCVFGDIPGLPKEMMRKASRDVKRAKLWCLSKGLMRCFMAVSIDWPYGDVINQWDINKRKPYRKGRYISFRSAGMKRVWQKIRNRQVVGRLRQKRKWR